MKHLNLRIREAKNGWVMEFDSNSGEAQPPPYGPPVNYAVSTVLIANTFDDLAAFVELELNKLSNSPPPLPQ